jgi:hypothetical protein
MKVAFNKSDLETAAARTALVRIVSDAKHGGFMRINGFRSKGGHGEVQDTTYCKGINYGEAVKRSLAMLDEIEKDESYKLTITRGTWKDTDGVENPTGRKSKVYSSSKTVTETYHKSSSELTEALGKVRASLTAPARPAKEYEKLGNGVYQDEAGTVFIRDLRLVKKSVVVAGDYPFKASKAVSSLVASIKKNMPVGKYRMFRLDAEFDNIALGGMEITPETNKTEQEKEMVAEVIAMTATA